MDYQKTYTIQLQNLNGDEIGRVEVVGEIDGYSKLPFYKGYNYIIDKYHDGRVNIEQFKGWDDNGVAIWVTVYEDVFIGYEETNE